VGHEGLSNVEDPDGYIIGFGGRPARRLTTVLHVIRRQKTWLRRLSHCVGSIHPLIIEEEATCEGGPQVLCDVAC
jgi:hypothetical protein